MRTHLAVTQRKFIHMAKSTPIQRHPHSASVKLCEKKFLILQYYHLSDTLDIPPQISVKEQWHCIGVW